MLPRRAPRPGPLTAQLLRLRHWLREKSPVLCVGGAAFCPLLRGPGGQDPQRPGHPGFWEDSLVPARPGPPAASAPSSVRSHGPAPQAWTAWGTEAAGAQGSQAPRSTPQPFPPPSHSRPPEVPTVPSGPGAGRNYWKVSRSAHPEAESSQFSHTARPVWREVTRCVSVGAVGLSTPPLTFSVLGAPPSVPLQITPWFPSSRVRAGRVGCAGPWGPSCRHQDEMGARK